MDELAQAIRAASEEWRAKRAAGTAREPDRPRVTLPDGWSQSLDNLTMAIVDAMEFLEPAGYSIVHVIHDYNENRVSWVSPSGRFIEVGMSSGPIVMVGPTKDGQIPRWEDGVHRHARDVVPANVAQTLPDMELEPGNTDISTTIPACVAWAKAALEATE